MCSEGVKSSQVKSSTRLAPAGTGLAPCTLQSTTHKADIIRASEKMASCGIRAALQILHSNTHAPQNVQAAAEINSLVAVDVDEDEPKRVKAQCVAIKRFARKCPHPPSPNWSSAWLGVALAAESGPSDMAAVGRSAGAEDRGMNPKLRSPAKQRNFGLLRRQLLLTVGRRSLNRNR